MSQDYSTILLRKETKEWLEKQKGNGQSFDGLIRDWKEEKSEE